MNTVNFKTKPITGKELLIGCGNNIKRQIKLPGQDDNFEDVVTLDVSYDCNPDVAWDLNHLPLPFEDESFEEIHAYEVLEHTGTQGDYKFFFKQFEEFHRILKPGGRLLATCPMWDTMWAWGDPGHTRIINAGSLVFLDQDSYKQIGDTPMTDYRSIYKGDFKVIHSEEFEDRFAFILEKK